MGAQPDPAHLGLEGWLAQSGGVSGPYDSGAGLSIDKNAFDADEVRTKVVELVTNTTYHAAATRSSSDPSAAAAAAAVGQRRRNASSTGST